MRERLRETFNEDAELYDRVRPGYPDHVFTDLDCTGRRVLEIGCGTGKATVPLARLGCRVTGVELGPAMAAVARRRLSGFPDVEIVTADFETWPLPLEPFDLVLAATAFHWLDPAIRVAKAADALRPGGVLAVIATHHVAGGSTALFAEIQRCYERFDPDTPPGLRLRPADELPEDSSEIDRSCRFGPARFQRYEWDQEYTTAGYLDVLRTYSGHRALPPGVRADLLGCIAHLIDGQGGRIVKRYLTEVLTAPRR